MRITTDLPARRRIAVLGALILAALALNAAPASASSEQHINTAGGTAHFYGGGTEDIFVGDIRADHQGVRAQLRFKGDVLSVNDFNGAGNGFEHQRIAIADNTKVELRLCYTDNGHNVQCSGWQKATA